MLPSLTCRNLLTTDIIVNCCFKRTTASFPVYISGWMLPRPLNLGSLTKHEPVVNKPPKSYEENDKITPLDYIQKFVSDQIMFPGDEKPQPFSAREMKDIGEIGRGTFGRVHKMKYLKNDRLVAVKKMRMLSNRSDELEFTSSLKRIQIEVDAIKKASLCEEIVQFYGVTFYEDDCWVCMELMDASLEIAYNTVHNILKISYFDEAVLGAVAVSTIKALDHLKSSLKIIHRDVKPSNILLDLHGNIKLCDFGISGYLTDSVAYTVEAGCRPYMAPERLQAKTKYDARSDVWSLGITMVEVAIGLFPYPDFSHVPLFEQLKMVVWDDPPLLLDPQYKPQTINFVNGCLVKDVEQRPTFERLMETDYYQEYSTLPKLKDSVSDYVIMILNARKQLS